MNSLSPIMAASRRRFGSAAYRAAVLADSPVAYWRLAETSGTTAADETGSYNGTYVGSPTLGVAGIFAGNTAFRSAAGKRMERNSAVVSGVLPFTLETWVKTSTTTNQNVLVVGNSAGTRASGISVAPTTGLVAAYSNGSGGTYYAVYGGFATTGNWMHVVGVFESTGIKVYLNGIESTLSQSFSSASDYAQVKCGSWLTFADPTIGDIDEAAIYSSALSADRILAHYNAAGYGGTDPDAAAYFAAIVAAGSTISSANQAAVNAFVVGCKTDGIWDAIKASCLLAGADTLAGALVPLVGAAPTNVSGNFVNGDYSRTTGLLGNGSSKFLSSNRPGNTDPQNSRHCAVWVYQVDPVAARRAYWGEYAGGAFNTYLRTETDNSVQGGINGALSLPSITKSAGIAALSRLNSTVNYRYHGISGSVSGASAGAINAPTVIFAQGTVAQNYSASRLSFYSLGENLNLALLDARLATYMSSLT